MLLACFAAGLKVDRSVSLTLLVSQPTHSALKGLAASAATALSNALAALLQPAAAASGGVTGVEGLADWWLRLVPRVASAAVAAGVGLPAALHC
jgi:hypothetical protein